MIKILNYTQNPLSEIGRDSGICYNTTNEKVFEKIAKQCLSENHGRTHEFVGIKFEFSGFSAKVIREIFRHKHMSELQASTRYIDYTKHFNYVTPNTIDSEEAQAVWNEAMENISDSMKTLKSLGVPTEDFSNLLPLAYQTKGVIKIELRSLIHMFGVRACACAYHEARKFMKEIKQAIKDLHDPQWDYIADNYLVPKCDLLLYCEEEKRCCGRHLTKSKVREILKDFENNKNK